MKIVSRMIWIRLGIICGVLVVAAGSVALFRYKLWPAYRTWSITRMNNMAYDFIKADDPRNALLTVRKVLGKRPNNAEALALGAKAADLRASPEAVFFQQRLCRVEKTPASHLELMRLALKYETYSLGVESIKAIADQANDRPEYHRLAAEIYRKIRRESEAKEHLVSLLALLPNDRAASLALAEVEFSLDQNHLPADWAERVAALTDDPASALPSLVLQLRSAVARRAVRESSELALRLLQRSDLTLSARLYVLEAFYLSDPAAADRMLATLQSQVASRADDVVQTMEFLGERSRFSAIKEWYAQLPQASQADERVKLGAAQAMHAVHDWTGMETILRGMRWTKNEPMRLALLAYAYRSLARPVDFAETWKLAVGATGQDIRKMVALLATLDKWRWDEERYDLLWKIFNLMPTVASVRDLLIAHEYRNSNTINLNKIYARTIEADPNDDDARNNFAYTSLLLGTNETRARQIARDLVTKHPANASYLTTHTLALYKQGLSREALELVEKLKPSDRTADVTLLHEALYAAGAGEADRAGRLLAGLRPVPFLPEERRFIDEARAGIARQEKDRNQSSEPKSPATAPDGWLALLPARDFAAPADLKRSDAFYREGNISALHELLQAGRWTTDDHLRYALLAYVERQQGRENTTRDLWRQASNTAGRDLRRLRELQLLAAKWDWPGERIAIVERIFENDISKTDLPGELLDYYRQRARTSDLARLYWRYVERTNTRGPDAAWCVYYNLLCGMNVTSAQTLAEKIYTAAPQDPQCKMAYAFSLWRQQRANEAWPFIKEMEKQELAGMQVQLLAAGVLLDLGRVGDAREKLAGFNKRGALPEEIAIAETLSRKMGLGTAAVVLSKK